MVRSPKLGEAVEVVGGGTVIPWRVRRADGWTCAAAAVPIAPDVPLSLWLAEAVGAKWKAVR